MVFPTRAGPRHFPVEGCSDRAATWTDMKVHLWHRHVQDTVVILEEGNLPHPRRPLCNMLVPWRSLNGSHNGTAQCKKGAEQKQWRLTAEEARAVTSRAFITYGRPLKIVTPFKYLGRVLSAADHEWTEVVQNLMNARTVWWKMSRILIREGAIPRVS